MTKTSTSSPTPIHYVLIDFENVHKIDVGMLRSNAVNMIVLAGAKEKKIDFDLVQGMLENASSLRLVRLKSSSRNAVDFALAYYLGQAVLEHSGASFHLVSKDKGYDPLVAHLRDRGFDVQRAGDCEALSFSWVGKGRVAKKTAKKGAKKTAKKVVKKVAKKAVKKAAKQLAKKRVVAGAKALTKHQAFERVYDNFQRSPGNLPARRKTLLSKIGQLIGHEAEGPVVAEVIRRLENASVLEFEGNTPIYSFSI